MKNLKGERWIKIPLNISTNYGYFVSNKGRICSKTPEGVRTLLKGSVSSGNLVITVTSNARRDIKQTVSIAPLIDAYFKPGKRKSSDKTICIDGNPANVHPDNLQRLSALGLARHQKSKGKFAGSTGETRLSLAKAKVIRLKNYRDPIEHSVTNLAREYKVTPRTIQRVISHELWPEWI